MLKKDKLIQEKYNGIHPTCQCGCGEQTRYEAKLKDFCKWVSGHQSRVAGHFGDPKSKKRVDAIIKTRKAKFESGEYNHIKQAVRNRDSIELGKKISKGSKGVSKPKAKGFGIGRIHSQETKDKMSKSAIERILKTGKVKRSGLEYKFEGLLDLLEIKYIHSYYIESIGKIYDFYLPKYNILIEVDGDFWHCNPIKHASPECKTQEINIENDKFKSQWASDNGYKLLRFWEDDINNNIKQVKQILLENCK
jgi:very-short-patch-repair endonuclease